MPDTFDNELNQHLEEPENNCGFCGEICGDYFCSDDCKDADIKELD